MIRARYSGYIEKGGEIIGYVWNCLKCISEENCDYLGDVVTDTQDHGKAEDMCKEKYGGGES